MLIAHRVYIWTKEHRNQSKILEIQYCGPVHGVLALAASQDRSTCRRKFSNLDGFSPYSLTIDPELDSFLTWIIYLKITKIYIITDILVR